MGIDPNCDPFVNWEGADDPEPKTTKPKSENFTVQYKFSSLAALADYLAVKATEKRASAADAKPKRKAELLTQAAAIESDAYLVRHSVIEP